ncbi:hypothetical protein Tsubulata_039142 [Turnera subulata]|uniref:Uncharacterized protein n=1 Tax=Turnera subulata TaxID=218843 RepID=A0A9Q0GIW7_9ROSI|nr:hypothetical protein Tsubulata_039142 [Turnera subulata]
MQKSCIPHNSSRVPTPRRRRNNQPRTDNRCCSVSRLNLHPLPQLPYPPRRRLSISKTHHRFRKLPPGLQAATSTNDGTPRTSAEPSPTINLTREYTLALQTTSYTEMWSRIHVPNPHDYDSDQIEFHPNTADQTLPIVLHPNQEDVEDALRRAKHNTLTRLASTYFKHSQDTTHLCLLLQESVYRARALYHPLHKLLDVLPLDSSSHSLTHSQCDSAFHIFLQFDGIPNPFPSPDSHNFQEMRTCFSLLRQQLERRLRKSRSRVSLVRRATSSSGLCVIASTVAVTVAAAAVATHALAAIVAAPFCTLTYLPSNFTRRELARIKQLDAAARGTYVLNYDLDTMDRLVARLYAAVEGDKHLVRLGIGAGKDEHTISEVLKQLQKNHLNFVQQLKDLEEHICLCFNAVNRARALLLQEIHLHQTSAS